MYKITKLEEKNVSYVLILKDEFASERNSILQKVCIIILVLMHAGLDGTGWGLILHHKALGK